MAKMTVAQEEYLRNHAGKLDNKELAVNTGLHGKTVAAFVKKVLAEAVIKEMVAKSEQANPEPAKDPNVLTGPAKHDEVSKVGKSGMVYDKGTVVMTKKGSYLGDLEHKQRKESFIDKPYIDTEFMKRTKIAPKDDEDFKVPDIDENVNENK